MKKLKYWLLQKLLFCVFKEMPFVVYPIFIPQKAGYDSWMIKGYTYKLLIPNKGTTNVIHLSHCDFAIFDDDFEDLDDGIMGIEDSNQPFFKTWKDAYKNALVDYNNTKQL